jgi:hypothetical protein
MIYDAFTPETKARLESRLTAEQRAGIVDAKRRYRELLEVNADLAMHRLIMFDNWNAASGEGQPPGDHEAELVRLDVVGKLLFCERYGLQPRERWLRILYGRDEEGGGEGVTG